MDVIELCFPVIELEGELLHLRGTAFGIGGPFLLTAAHVLSECSNNTNVVVGFRGTNDALHHCKVTQLEIIEGYDLGIIRADVFPKNVCVPWWPNLLTLLSDVFTAGFPHGIDHSLKQFHLRAFRGHTASDATGFEFSKKPRVYELSFQAPRGISGAPLFHVDKGKAFVAGIVVGQRSTEMTVFSSRERIAEGDKEVIVEKVEALNLGLAIANTAILEVESELLGGKVKDHLRNNGLLS